MHFLAASAAITAILGLTSALPSPHAHRRQVNVIRPTTSSIYHVWTGAVEFNTPNGKIFKDGISSDLTTLLTFDLPAAAGNRTCELHFALDSAPTSIVTGTGQFDVFTSLAPATQSSSSWPSGNLRDQYVGRAAAKVGAEATWVDGFPSVASSFPCPSSTTLAAELVGTGDNDDIEWVAGAGSGAYINWY